MLSLDLVERNEASGASSSHNNYIESAERSSSFMVEEQDLDLPNNHPSVIRKYKSANPREAEEKEEDTSKSIRINFNQHHSAGKDSQPETPCFDIVTDRECIVALRNHFSSINKPQRA